MTDLTFDDPCILFALRRESSAFRREFRPQQSFPGAPCWARFCGPSWLTVLVLETGLGAERTETAVQWLLSKPVLGKVPYRPKLVLSAGFAGALDDSFQVGDILLATDVSESDGTCWPATWPGNLPPGEWRRPLRRGRLLTASRLVSSPQDKATLGRQNQAAVVDMESVVAARLCHRHGVPFGCVRAVSDDMNSVLSPQMVSLLDGGRVSWLGLLRALAFSPRLVREMIRLGRDTRNAEQQLGAALGELLTLTLPGGATL